jgi:small GTP-binding protein
MVNDKIVKLQLWDTANQERYRAIISAYYRGASAVVVVYDATKSLSATTVEHWLQYIHNYCNDDPIIILFGNKNDCLKQNISTMNILTADITMHANDAKQIAVTHNLLFFEGSAKNGTEINEMFRAIVHSLVQKAQ